MTNVLKTHNREIQRILEDHYLPVYYKKLTQHQEFMDEVHRLVKTVLRNKDLKVDEASFETFRAYKAEIQNLIKRHFEELPFHNNLGEEYEAFDRALNTYIETVPELLVEEQPPERFASQPDDKLFIKVGKPFKNFYYWLKSFPIRFANVFRKLFKKKIVSITTPRHTVRLRDLIRYYFKEDLYCELNLLNDQYYHQLAKASIVVWKVDEKIDEAIDKIEKQGFLGKEIKVGLTLIKEEMDRVRDFGIVLDDKAHDAVEEVARRASYSFEKVGTFELWNRRFGSNRAAKQRKRAEEEFARINQSWDNTFTALSDDWEIDVELYGIIYQGISRYESVKTELHKRYTGLHERFDEVQGVLAEQQDKLKVTIEGLQAQRKWVLGTLTNQHLKPMVDDILSQDFLSVIHNIEGNLERSIENINRKRMIIRNVDYTKPQKKASVHYVNPDELISFECWPAFKNVMKNARADINILLNELEYEVMQISEIIAYNLESVIDLIEDEELEKDPKTIASEGYDRAMERLTRCQERIKGVQKTLEETIHPGLEEFNERLRNFTDNENINEIRLRIAKAKAIQRSKELRQKWMENLKQLFPVLWKKTVQTYEDVRGRINELFKKYGLAKTEVKITSEISDFLAETAAAIDKLPFVYQRLFRNTALTDLKLFEGRQTEINALNKAYNNWTRGRFASTIITGEKGGGATSLLNYFLNDLSTSAEVVHLKVKSNLCSEEAVIKLFNETFGKSFRSSKSVMDFLESGPKRIIVLENLERFFMKKVNGFIALETVREYISRTNHHIFWVVSCTIYTWDYLDKTKNIAEVFSYNIPLEDVGDDKITSLILKRHEVSGYNLQFVPSREDINSKKFNKLTPSEQQKKLKADYFTDLNKIAKGNISLALIYWLRSTERVESNTIYIMSLDNLDFTFMTGISNEKLFVLHLLLLHERLRLSQFAEVYSSTEQESIKVLNPLFEDGILGYINDEFFINPLLYRQTVSLLKSKNIIH